MNNKVYNCIKDNAKNIFDLISRLIALDLNIHKISPTRKLANWNNDDPQNKITIINIISVWDLGAWNALINIPIRYVKNNVIGVHIIRCSNALILQ